MADDAVHVCARKYYTQQARVVEWGLFHARWDIAREGTKCLLGNVKELSETNTKL